MEEPVIEKRIIVSGYVQGVSFRNWTKRLAQEYSVTGWVKNTPHETVEICGQAKRSVLDEFINQIRQRGGPRIASIEGITFAEVPFEVRYNSFDIVK